jgi:hypothetical protein
MLGPNAYVSKIELEHILLIGFKKIEITSLSMDDVFNFRGNLMQIDKSHRILMENNVSTLCVLINI